MHPEISLLMANYNQSKFIKQAIESVLNQTYPNWELIIIDDASTDNSLEIIAPYLKDKRIKLIKHKKNQGYGAALKTAVKYSSTNILGRIDSDDALHKNAVEIMIKAHKDHPNYGFIYSTYYNCDENLKIEKIVTWPGQIKQGETNIKKNCISHFSTFKKTAYKKTEGFVSYQKKSVDRDISYKIEEVTKLKYIDKPLYFYRRNENGISQGQGIKERPIYKTLAIYNAYLRRINTNIPNISRNEMAKKLLMARDHCLKINKPKVAKQFYKYYSSLP